MKDIYVSWNRVYKGFHGMCCRRSEGRRCATISRMLGINTRDEHTHTPTPREGNLHGTYTMYIHSQPGMQQSHHMYIIYIYSSSIRSILWCGDSAIRDSSSVLFGGILIYTPEEPANSFNIYCCGGGGGDGVGVGGGQLLHSLLRSAIENTSIYERSI